jgi:superfamily II helicase
MEIPKITIVLEGTSVNEDGQNEMCQKIATIIGDTIETLAGQVICDDCCNELLEDPLEITPTELEALKKHKEALIAARKGT